MSAAAAKNNLSLEDYAELLADMKAAGYDFAVIGGCALGVYAAKIGGKYLSMDLDVYMESHQINSAAEWLRSRGVTVVHRPQPREIPVTILEWQGKRVDLLPQVKEMPEPRVVYQFARNVVLKNPPLEVLIADPFDLLRNKIHVNRPKDRPHIAILREFCELEILEALRTETVARERIDPARRWLWAHDSLILPTTLFGQMLALARGAADFRFLMHHAPSKTACQRSLRAAMAAKLDGQTERELRYIFGRRRFPRRVKQSTR